MTDTWPARSTTAIDALVAKGNTVIPAGSVVGLARDLADRALYRGHGLHRREMGQGHRCFSPTARMTSSQGSNGFDKSYYNAFGFAKNGHLGSTSGSNAEATLDSKTTPSATPSRPKRQGISSTPSASRSRRRARPCSTSCATKPDMFYNSPTNDQLAGDLPGHRARPERIAHRAIGRAGRARTTRSVGVRRRSPPPPLFLSGALGRALADPLLGLDLLGDRLEIVGVVANDERRVQFGAQYKVCRCRASIHA